MIECRVVAFLVLLGGTSAFFQQTSAASKAGKVQGGRPAVAASNGNGSFDCTYAALYPRQYVAYKLNPDDPGLTPATLDGDLTKAVWEEVPWTENFVDISTDTLPKFNTAAKIRWDDAFLYVGAMLQEPNVWATLTEHDSVVFNDNDFEIFVDANATTHFYKEFEMNALNTTWDLCLDMPYSDNGYENSSRVFPTSGFDMQPPLKCAVSIDPSESNINDPSTPNNFWSVEVALPLAGLMLNSTDQKPDHGSKWRINFSRVEWGVTINETSGEYVKTPSCQSCEDPGSEQEDNWVWSPMQAVAMHNPERWAILQFSTNNDPSTAATPFEYYDEWPARAAAAAVYWAQRSYASAHNGSFASTYAALAPFTTGPYHLCPTAQVEIQVQVERSGTEAAGEATNEATALEIGELSKIPSDVTNGGGSNSGGGVVVGYTASVLSPDGASIVAMITNDRYLTVSRTDKAGN